MALPKTPFCSVGDPQSNLLCKQPAEAVAAVSIEELRAELARREAVEED